ncbi:MAG TPA: paraslipin, partial [Gammaproteobacteria bacterium]|nr:paraslipin [Gammaproteobacteria bacterium]
AQSLRAEGQAQAILKVANATATALETIGISLRKEGAQEAMTMRVAESFIEKWGAIAKESNVMIVPADMGDIAKTVGTAFRIVEGARAQ